MRLCAAARSLAVASIALMVGYAYEVGVWGPYWPVWPHSWRVIGEFGIVVCAISALVSVVIAAHGPDSKEHES